MTAEQEMASSEQDDCFLGTLLAGKFRIESLIGEGGMSVVYKATQDAINRPVAIKFLRKHLCEDEFNVKRFERESRAVSKLAHPNLVAIYDIGTTGGGQPYMVMEYLKGRALSDLLEEKTVIPVDRALDIFIQLAEVMHYAHGQGFIHRDLKPQNIMLVEAGEKKDFVKLVDFGIVKLDGIKQESSQKLTAQGEICGSPFYMSPEQVLDQQVDARSDIYSFGVVMYECLSGRPVFGGAKITDVLSKHVNVPPMPFQQVAPELEIPPAMEGIIFKALEKRPDRRFQNMEELRSALSGLQRRLRGDAVSRPPYLKDEPVPIDKARKGLESGPAPALPPVVFLVVGCLLIAAAVFAAQSYFSSVQKTASSDFAQSKTNSKANSGKHTPARAGTGHSSADVLHAQEMQYTPRSNSTLTIFEPLKEPAPPEVITPKPVARTQTAPRRAQTDSLSDELEAIERANVRRPKPRDVYSSMPE